MRKRNYKLTALLTMLCVMLTMSFTTVGYAADAEMQETLDRLNQALGEIKNGTTDSESTESAAASNADVKLVKPEASIRGLPDDTLNLELPSVSSSVHRKCKVSAATLLTLAERAYTAGENEFYINAAYSTKEISETTVEIESGMYPFGNGGRLCSMGILTNDGYLRISAQTALSLLDENVYKKITITTSKRGETGYRISIYGYGTDGENGSIFDLPEGGITFTVWPKDSFLGKELSCGTTGNQSANFSTRCRNNADGSVSFDTVGTGNYMLGVYVDPYAQPQVKHTLEVVNDEYGFADLAASNRYELHANSGGYLQDVFINGVSKGAITSVDVSEGDEVFVIFAKQGEKVDTTQYDVASSAAASAAAKLERTKSGVKATSIKLSTVSGIKKGVKISWKKSAGYKLDYYEIWRSVKKSSGFKKISTTKNAKKTSYTNTKTTKGKRYYYKVRGVRVLENQKVYTKWSNTCYRKAV